MNIPQDIILAAQASEVKFYPKGPFVSITLAQWIVESGWGRHQSGKNNYFGIKATPAQIAAGKATLCRTREVINGISVMVNLYFADYESVEEGFDAHAALLTMPSMAWAYAECWSAATPEAYAEALAKHYATDPHYAGVLVGVIVSCGLKQYDVKH